MDPVSPQLTETRAWARITRGDLAAARTDLKARLDALPERYSDWELMSLLLDLVHASSDDAGLQAHWLEKARSIAAAMDPRISKAFGQHLCTHRERDYWKAVQERARRANWQRVAPTEHRCPPGNVPEKDAL